MGSREIKNAGLKVTLPRTEVLGLLERHPDRHLTAEEIYRLLEARHSDIGLPTIYRVLSQLEAAGLVTRRHFARGGAVFELRRDPHHSHLLCVRCGRIEEFTDEEIEARQRAVAERVGYALREYSLVIYGRCKAGCGPQTAS